jgi:LemA protein
MENNNEISHEALALQIVEENRQKRRQTRRIAIASVGILSLMIAISSFYFLNDRLSASAEPAYPAMKLSLPPQGPGLDAYITEAEERARATGNAEIYESLSQALDKRYQLMHQPQDHDGAIEAASRAQRLSRRQNAFQVPQGAMVFLLIVIPVVTLLLFLAILANVLNQKDEACDVQWAQIQTQLQRRLDLLPELLTIVMSYAKHERETLSEITRLREKAAGSLRKVRQMELSPDMQMPEIAQEQAEIASAIQRLLVLTENYPDLKASPHFLRLQQQLEATENMILVGRQAYNAAVGRANTLLRIFPFNVSAALAGLDARQYFEASTIAENPVSIATKNEPTGEILP